LLLSRLAIDGIVHTSAVFHAAFPEQRSKMYQRHPKSRKNRKGFGMVWPQVHQGFTLSSFQCQTKFAAPETHLKPTMKFAMEPAELATHGQRHPGAVSQSYPMISD
jgi:hypothetical protein